MFTALDTDQDGFLNGKELAELAKKTSGELTNEQ